MSRRIPAPVKFMFLKAFKTSFPGLLSHLPLGMVYGVLCYQAGFAWFYGPLFSLCVLAGAMQFVALSLVAAGASLFMIACAIIPLGIRNIFYGMTLLEPYEKAPLPLRLYLAHGLVDATYSLLHTNEERNLRYITWLTVLNHLYWVLGTLLGSFIPLFFELPSGLEFSLTAFFAATAVEQFLKRKEVKAVAIAAIAIILSLLLLPNHFFLGCIGVAILLSLALPMKERIAA